MRGIRGSAATIAAAIVAVACPLHASGARAANENVVGQWSGLINLPLVPSSGAVLKTGKVLLWSADGEFSFAADGTVKATLFDPATLTNVRRDASVGHNMFCTGTTLLADGKLLVNGGSNAPVTSLYDPDTGAFTRVQDMVTPRGYNGNTILADGSVLTIGGSWSNDAGRKDGEIWTPAAGWRAAPGLVSEGMTSPNDLSATGRDSHYVVIPSGNGRVLYAAPHPTMRWIDTTGSGAVKVAGQRGDDDYATSGNALMYDTGRILKTGGSPTYSGSAASDRAYDIDVRTGAPAVTKLPPMIYPRAYHNSVVLPDGKVMLIGGQTYAANFQDTNSVLITEIWDPKTGLFRNAAPIAVGRNYHSIALLLPDGRVLSGGGGLCGNCTSNHPDVQLYSPGYLFDRSGNAASRPSIVSAPDALVHGRAFSVSTDRAVAAFSLVRMGATTHTVNADQRRLSLAFAQTGANSYRVETPSNAGYLLPGYWMLFALDAAGVPSVAKILRVDVNGVADMVAPEAVLGVVGAPVSVQPNAVRKSALARFSAVGLPGGLSVDPLTGAITGSPLAVGTYPASLVATLGDQTVSTDFLVVVDPPPSAGDGLLGQYFPNANLGGAPALTRREAVDFDFGSASPGPGVPAVFSARWTGKLRASRGGVTRFRTTSDDGVRLWIGGKLVVDNWTQHGATDDEGQIELAAGADYDVFLEYFNGGGAGVMRLAWRRPGDPDFAAVPAAQLFSGDAPSAANVAAGKAALQSSEFSGGAAARAVDGGVNGSFAAGSVAHTALEDNPWWQVDLGRRMRVDFVRIWRRSDCCLDQSQNLTVLASDADMSGRSLADLMADPAVAKRSYGSSNVTDFIDVALNGTTRFLRVQSTVRAYLSIAEFQAFGAAANGAPGVVQPGPQTARVGVEVSLAVVATDPDGDALRFTAEGLPPGLAIDAATGLVSGVPTAGGTFSSAVTATDPSGLSARAAFEWTVARLTPEVAALRVRPAKVGEPVKYSATILNGEGATYRWSFGDGTKATPFRAQPSAKHAFEKPGVYGAVLTIRAADGRQTTYFFDQSVYEPSPADLRGVASATSGFEARPSGSGRFWISNPDNDSVSVIAIKKKERVAEIPVGRSPQGVLVTPQGKVWVANRDSATISVIDANSLAVERTIALPAGSRPYGLARLPGGQVIVTLEALGRLMLLGPNGEDWGAAEVGPSPRHVAVAADGSRAYVSRFVTPPLPGENTAAVQTVGPGGAPVGGEIRVVNLTGAVERTIVLAPSDQVDTTVSGRGVPNYLGAAAIAPDGRSAWVPSKQDNVFRGTLRSGEGLNFQNTVRAIVSRVDLATGKEDLSSRIDVDNSGVAAAVAIHPTGAYLFVALPTSREVAVLDPAGRREIFRFRVGRAPQTLTLTPDGATLLVGNFMDRTVSIVDLAKLTTEGRKEVEILATVPTVRKDKLGPQALLGKQIFYDAADPRIARDGYVSCASCHDNAEGDGRTWDFTGSGEGLRNTPTLLGRRGMGQGNLHWSANFDEVQDFEGQMRTLAGGSGLMPDALFFAGTRSQPLGDKKAGLSPELDALAAYLKSLSAEPRSPFAPADGGLSTNGLAGKAVFDRLACAACHAGAAMTNSKGAGRMRDVGTIKASSGSRLGGPLKKLDVPTLRGLWATAPYLHDGSAPTLEAAIRRHSNVKATDADAARLADYLRELGPQ